MLFTTALLKIQINIKTFAQCVHAFLQYQLYNPPILWCLSRKSKPCSNWDKGQVTPCECELPHQHGACGVHYITSAFRLRVTRIDGGENEFLLYEWTALDVLLVLSQTETKENYFYINLSSQHKTVALLKFFKNMVSRTGNFGKCQGVSTDRPMLRICQGTVNIAGLE